MAPSIRRVPHAPRYLRIESPIGERDTQRSAVPGVGNAGEGSTTLPVTDHGVTAAEDGVRIERRQLSLQCQDRPSLQLEFVAQGAGGTPRESVETSTPRIDAPLGC